MTMHRSPFGPALLMAMAAPALAQPGQPPAGAGDADAKRDGKQDPARPRATELDTVNVQGQRAAAASTPKFTAPLLDTPRAVTVIPQQVLQETATTNLLDALRTVPGITFGAGEGGNPNGDRPIIRGFDSENSIFIDGVRSSGSRSRETFAIDQIEVTKGPSSAYTGRGAVGGSVNLVTKAPKARDFIAGSLGLGTDQYGRATVDINQAVSDGIALRLNAMAHRNDIADRGGPQNTRWGVAPAIAFGLGTDSRLTVDYYHLETDNIPDSGIPYDNPNNFAAGSGRPLQVPHDTYYGLLARDFQKSQEDIGTVKFERHFSNSFVWRSTLVSGKSSNDYLWTQPDDSQGNFIVNNGVWRRANSRVSETRSRTLQSDLSGNFSTGPVEHAFSAGLEVADEKTWRDNYTLTPSFTGAVATGACSLGVGAASGYWCALLTHPDPADPWIGTITRTGNVTHIDTDTRAGWLFDTLTLSPQWLVNLGVRWDSFQTESSNATVGAIGNDATFFNYQGGLVFKPIQSGSIYLSYATSSNPPGSDAGDGSDALALTNNDLEPERSRNIELGTKWDILGGGAQLSAALFRTEKTNARVATGGRGSDQVNAGKQRVDGVELGISGSIADAWAVFAGYTYLDSELLKPAPSDLASTGNQFPNTPRQAATLWTSYAVSPRLKIGGGAFYQSRVYGNTANTKWVPSFTRYDAMASYVVNRSLSVQLNVQNLFDKSYFDKAFTTHYASLAPGRSATITLNLRFD
jgi:catecholate siderophore receptor